MRRIISQLQTVIILIVTPLHISFLTFHITLSSHLRIGDCGLLGTFGTCISVSQQTGYVTDAVCVSTGATRSSSQRVSRSVSRTNYASSMHRHIIFNILVIKNIYVYVYVQHFRSYCKRSHAVQFGSTKC